MAVTESSYLGFRQISPVVICDFAKHDDPFGPDHVSSVYTVEVRQYEYDQICYTIIIWQRSLLDGRRKEVVRFEMRFGYWVGYRAPLQCFECSGVIFILLRWEVFTYDVRYEKWQTFRYRQFGWVMDRLDWHRNSLRKLASISCLRRIWREEDGKKVLYGWMIRTIGTEGYRIFPQSQLRLSLTKTVFEIFVSGEVREVSSEGVVFSHYLERCYPQPIRTSSAFGILYTEYTLYGQWMLFDESTNSYVYCADANELIALEPAFRYLYFPLPPFRRGLCPIFMNSRECIGCCRDGTVHRNEFAAPTLKYATAKALFQAIPDLRFRMNADDFRRETGIGGMEAHFRS